jgi:hypothetical protein
MKDAIGTTLSAESLWRAEGRIVGYSLINAFAAACLGYTIGVGGGVIDVGVVYTAFLGVIFFTGFAMSVASFIGKNRPNTSTFVVLGILWLMWLVAALGVMGVIPTLPLY